jgi:hypothetical protein
VFSFPVGVIGEADTRFALRGLWHFRRSASGCSSKSGRSLTQLQRQMLSSIEEIVLPKQLFQRRYVRRTSVAEWRHLFALHRRYSVNCEVFRRIHAPRNA